jgi:O-antigen biosynthesis protein
LHLKTRQKGKSVNTPGEPARPDSNAPSSDVRRCLIEDQYPALVRNNRIRRSDLVRLRDEASNFEYRPLVSVLLPVSDPERQWLERTLDSMLGQAYPLWELRVCGGGSAGERTREALERYERLDGRIEVAYQKEDASVAGSLNAALSRAGGEFVAILNAGDELEPDALFAMVRLLQKHPGADLIYSDEDRIDAEGNRSNPHFKPGWSPDLLLSADYISRLSLYRKSLLDGIGGFREGFDGCEGYDLVLRATEQTGGIHHVPKVLYHRRTPAGPSAPPDQSPVRDRIRQALSDALERRGFEGSVEEGLLPDRFRVRFEIKGKPKVSIIIPTRDNAAFLRRCVGSLERLTTYRNYEILIIDNNSRDPKTLEYLGSMPHRVIPFREAFNYSRINNFAVSHAAGEYVLLLNDDTEVIDGSWLEAMLEHAQRPEVGVVGARLLYPDGRIQHAGVVVGVGSPWEPGVAMHAYHFYSSDSPGHLGTLRAATNYSAVTAACMLVRKSLFEQVGGLQEEDLPIQFNDVDLCLKIRERGYYVVYTPYAELYHHESVSRGHFSGNRTENLWMRERWGTEMDNDPYYNANFSRAYGDFNLRADLMRPRILRQEAELEDLPSWAANPLEHQRRKEDQHFIIRSSSRTTLIPKPANGAAEALPTRAPATRGGGYLEDESRPSA